MTVHKFPQPKLLTDAEQRWLDNLRATEGPNSSTLALIDNLLARLVSPPAQEQEEPVAYRHEKLPGPTARAYTEVPDEWYPRHGWVTTPLLSGNPDLPYTQQATYKQALAARDEAAAPSPIAQDAKGESK